MKKSSNLFHSLKEFIICSETLQEASITFFEALQDKDHEVYKTLVATILSLKLNQYISVLPFIISIIGSLPNFWDKLLSSRYKIILGQYSLPQCLKPIFTQFLWLDKNSQIQNKIATYMSVEIKQPAKCISQQTLSESSFRCNLVILS